MYKVRRVSYRQKKASSIISLEIQAKTHRKGKGRKGRGALGGGSSQNPFLPTKHPSLGSREVEKGGATT